MLVPLALVVASKLAYPERVKAFLAYQDTIFAVRRPMAWAEPSRESQIPRESLEVAGLGLSSVRSRYAATLDPWDDKTSTWTIACEGFEEVLGWGIEPHYPRRLVRRLDEKKQAKLYALQLLKEQRVVPDSLKDPNVYAIDLDGSGGQEFLVDIVAKVKDHEYGLAFLYCPKLKPTTLEFSRDGWPRILSVVSLDDDVHMQIIVGGTTTAGKTVSLWQFNHQKLTRLAGFTTSP